MISSSETRRQKAKQFRYRKSIVKDVNLEAIQEDLYEITSACEDVKWYFDSDDETLINALDGDEDEAYEFKMMFCDLWAECERMSEDLQNEYIPECFDSFFVAIGAGDVGGGLLGYDSYEQDYFGLSCTDEFAEEKAAEKLRKLTKEQLIESSRICFKVYHSYIGIKHRHDCLKASMDILRDENTGYLQMVKKIEEVYEKANDAQFCDWDKSTKELGRLAKSMPDEVWIQ